MTSYTTRWDTILIFGRRWIGPLHIACVLLTGTGRKTYLERVLVGSVRQDYASECGLALVFMKSIRCLRLSLQA